MAGLPAECIARSREILTQLESGNHRVEKTAAVVSTGGQLDLFGEHPALLELRDLDVDNLTPVQALNALEKLKKKV
jgi:DNA mismatch repair protein MutS